MIPLLALIRLGAQSPGKPQNGPVPETFHPRTADRAPQDDALSRVLSSPRVDFKAKTSSRRTRYVSQRANGRSQSQLVPCTGGQHGLLAHFQRIECATTKR